MGFLVASAGGVAIGLLLLWISARSAITIAVLEIHDGELRVTRGGLSPRVLGDLRDVTAHSRRKSATIRILRSRDHARVEIKGDLEAHHVQRIRNVIGSVKLAQLVNGRRR